MRNFSVRIHQAFNRRPEPRDVDTYTGVQVAIVMQHLKGEPFAWARMSDKDALKLAAELVQAVAARAADRG